MLAHVVRVVRRTAALAVWLGAAAGCRGDSSAEPRPTPPRLVVKLSLDTATLVLDDTARLSATVTDERGLPVAAPAITWSADPQSVATVGPDGTVVTQAQGTVTITARAGGASASARIHVAPHYTGVSPGAYHTCGVTGLGEAVCWGSGWSGATGRGSPAPQDATCSDDRRCVAYARPVVGAPRVVDVVAGWEHNCALTATGEALCWGFNWTHQVGDGSTAQIRYAASRVLGGIRFTSLALGRWHSCGLSIEGDAYCWGADGGRLGLGGSAPDPCAVAAVASDCARTPKPVVGGNKFVALAAAAEGTCALTAAGDVYCWGPRYIPLDSPACQGRVFLDCVRTPLRVAGPGFVELRLTDGSVCARLASGEIRCWGRNGGGEFGNGTLLPSPTPTPAGGGSSYASFAAGEANLCALDGARAAVCWGSNILGQIGNPEVGARALFPTRVAGDLVFARISASNGSARTCAISTAGRAYCWGEGVSGGLGSGVFESSARPVQVLRARS